MSATSNAPSKSLTPPPTVPSPNLSSLAKQTTLPASSASPAISASPINSPSPLMSSTTASATLSVPKATPTKSSRQGTNPDKPTTLAVKDPYAGLPSGLPPVASGLSANMARLGTRSPSSIPSSPTSIHSSSSAIFERDIEPIGLPSLSVPLTTAQANPAYPSRSAANNHNQVNQHRIPRSKTTEALEMTVPSVLDSAVNALTIAEESGTSITVLSPVPPQSGHPLAASTAQSPLTSHPSPTGTQFPPTALNAQGGIGSLGSISGTSGGSPSPPTMSLLLQGMGMSGLVSASASVSGAAPGSTGFASGFASPLGSSRSPSPARSASPPTTHLAELTPAAAAAAAAAAAGGSPRSTKEVLNFSTSSPIKRPSLPPPVAPGLRADGNAPSPNMRASNRLSFISYNDVLTSAPIGSQSLSSVLSPGQHEPPTHLLVVDADNGSSVLGMTPTTSTGNLPLGGVGSLNVGGAGDKIDVDSLGTVGLSSTGEWGREGLGGGLEERLERLWAAEREIAERGRVMSPTRLGPTSRSTSMSAPADAPTSTIINPPPLPTTTVTAEPAT